uniref:Uncharacterized protein n=1 Tax=Timema shepardi TaxID=629360 RepID=A0A7R9FZ50_TIMSH|nr:unnamed protein product [Timema shepardi]
MYVGPESDASRGAQELSSCLLNHINNVLPSTTKSFSLYSDSCEAAGKVHSVEELEAKIRKSSHTGNHTPADKRNEEDMVAFKKLLANALVVLSSTAEDREIEARISVE